MVKPTAFGRREFWWSSRSKEVRSSWALGSVLSKNGKQQPAIRSVHTAWQVVFAGFANLAYALAFERNMRVLSGPRADFGAIFYLVVCGSWIGYTAYIWLLQHVPTSKVATYAYVNPVVAVFLGWLVLHERIDRYIADGEHGYRGFSRAW